MRFLDALLGRSRPAGSNLDRLFALPGAAVTLQASEALVTTGTAAVCFKPAVGPGFAQTETELAALLESGPSDDDQSGGLAGRTTLRRETDTYGYRWVVVEAADVDELVTRVHFVNSTLEAHGYGPQLLCSVFGFGPAPSSTGLQPLGQASLAPDPGSPLPTAQRASAYLVYLFKRGSFYPFAPRGGQQRDNEVELRLKALLGGDLAIEQELDRWFPLWELPIS